MLNFAKLKSPFDKNEFMSIEILEMETLHAIVKYELLTYI